MLNILALCMYEISSCMKTLIGSMYKISSCMKTLFGSMYEISSCYDRGFLIDEIMLYLIMYELFHDPYRVLYGIAWFCMVLHGIAWYYIVLHGIAWNCMA